MIPIYLKLDEREAATLLRQVKAPPPPGAEMGDGYRLDTIAKRLREQARATGRPRRGLFR